MASPEDSVADILPRLTDCADRRARISDGHLAGIITPSDITRMIDRLGLPSHDGKPAPKLPADVHAFSEPS
jgi:hypothetical protein